MSNANARWLTAAFAHWDTRTLKGEASCFHRSWVTDNSRAADLAAAEMCWAEIARRAS